MQPKNNPEEKITYGVCNVVLPLHQDLPMVLYKGLDGGEAIQQAVDDLLEGNPPS